MNVNDRLVNIGGLWVPPGTIVLPVWIDLTLPYAELIRRGQYPNKGWALANITEDRFPVDHTAFPSKKFWAPTLLVPPYRKDITVSEQAAEMATDHLPLGAAVHVLSLGASMHYRDLPYDVVGLGSSWYGPDGDPDSPELWSFDGKRRLHLRWCLPEHELDEDARFVAAPQAVT